MVGVALGVLTAGSSVHAAENPDYTKDQHFDPSKCYWATVNATYQYAEAYAFLEEVNDYREENGLDRVPTNDYCMRIAMQRALECNVRITHESPWSEYNFLAPTQAAILGLYNHTGDVAQDVKNGMLKFSAAGELCHGQDTTKLMNLKEALEGLEGFEDHSVLNDRAVAMGVGIVNNCIVTIAFSKTDIFSLSSDSRTLTNYTATMKVPVLTSYADTVDWGAYEFVKVDKSTYCNGTKNEAEDKEEEEEEEKEEKKTSSESKTVKATKVSGVKVTRKKAGKYTKLTVKFSKVKKVKGIKYQIQVAKNKKFKSAKKATTSSTKKTFSINYKGKKAYIRVRCYKKINGKTVYGKWSSIKTIKTYK